MSDTTVRMLNLATLDFFTTLLSAPVTVFCKLAMLSKYCVVTKMIRKNER
jgi:hypothetical protein